METRTLLADEVGALDEAVAILGAGSLVAIPTETVYGLAGDATDGLAVARIYEAKGRPAFNPLIAHVADMEMARSIATFDEIALRLADAFWPGPLTMVLPLASGSPIHPLARAGLPSVAVRMPRGPAREIVRMLGRPLAAPSANPSGSVSPTTATRVATTLAGRVDLVLDGGACAMGLESTIVRSVGSHLALLRPGSLTAEDIEDATGLAVRAEDHGVVAPGQLTSHYAPHGRVRLDAANVERGEHLVSFGPGRLQGEETAASVINLSSSGDLREAATNLFAVLARLDSTNIERIAVAAIPRSGLGVAINDRLARAAAPR